MDIQEVINYVLTTPENTNPAVLKGMLEQLSGGSGGGGGESGDGDFTIAEVTIVSEVLTNFESFNMYAIYAADELGEGSPAGIMNYVAVPAGETVKIKVPLYKGEANFVNTPLGALHAGSTVAGDITKTQNSLMIEGDGTITLVSAT